MHSHKLSLWLPNVGRKSMKGIYIKWAILICFVFGLTALAQTGINATLSGTVSDPTGALIPGVEVTAKNTATGVASTSITNESGTYRFASLQPGAYEVRSTLAGFQAQTFRLNL